MKHGFKGFCNQRVAGSSPAAGTIGNKGLVRFQQKFRDCTGAQLARNLAQKKVNRPCSLRQVCRIEWRVDLCCRVIRRLMSELGRDFPCRNALHSEPACNRVSEGLGLDVSLQTGGRPSCGPAPFHTVHSGSIIQNEGLRL